jgi:hypothetical protein
MRVRARTHPAPLVLALAASLALPAAALAASETVPLPAADYGVRAACRATAPHRAHCMALTLVPRTAAARAHRHPLAVTRTTPLRAPSPAGGAFGLRPGDLHAAYQLPTAASGAQTIALVDAYNDPTAEADLATYDQEFGLPECTAADGCLTQLNEAGESGNPPFPKTAPELQAAEAGTPAEAEAAELARGWELETSLDLQAAHATCQTCRIVLVAASSAEDEDLVAAEQTAVARGANEISNSWGGPEAESSSLAGAFDHPGTVITASAGDGGYLEWDGEWPGYASFPAAAPGVVAVGGTRLAPLGPGSSYAGETVWNGNGAAGGGCSEEFAAPAWQRSVADWAAVGCGSGRAVADVAAVGDPYTGLAVYDSNPECATEYEEGGLTHSVHWCTVGGTSLASPLIAAVFALAGGASGVPYPAQTLYASLASRPGALHDVTQGSNGQCAAGYDTTTGLSSCSSAEEAQTSCESQLICLAGPGYDGPTGVGTPAGIAAFSPAGPGAGSSPAQLQAARAPATQPAPAGPPAGGASSAPAPAPSAAGRVLALSLTSQATLALRRGHVRAAAISFVLTLSAPALLHVTLSRQVRLHGRLVWRAVGGYTVRARAGRQSVRAPVRGLLARGRYRLTVTPSRGATRTLSFRV